MIISSEIRLFLIFFISGILIGVFFDIFRIIRRCFKVSDIHTYLEDILFGIITGIFLIFVIFIYNDGNIRLFMFIGLFLGIVIYLITISKYFIKINVLVLTIIKNTVTKTLKVLFYPFKKVFKLVKKAVNKPFMLLIINIKKFTKIFMIKKDKKRKNIY